MISTVILDIFFRFWEYCGRISGYEGILVILEGLELVLPFCRFPEVFW
jgi:hypothetical protein